MLLADLGAEVIKIEDPAGGEVIRDLIPGLYEAVNRNKLGLTLNLKYSAGKEIFYNLVKKSHVVVEGFRPGVVNKLGVDYETLKKINPSLVYCSISGYGQTGPYRTRPGHDINYAAMSGVLSLPGSMGKPPQRASLPLADLSGSMFAAISILAALLDEKGNEEKGTYIDVCMLECLMSWTSVRAGSFVLRNEDPIPEEMGHLTPNNDSYTCKDNKGLSFGAFEDHFWKKLCVALERDDLIKDPRFSTHGSRIKNFKELKSIIQKCIGKYDRGFWLERFGSTDVPFAPIYTIKESFEDPHILERELLEIIEDNNGKRLRQILYPGKFSEKRPMVRLPPPRVGEHTEKILKELDYSRKDIDMFRSKGII
ncbi:MAG: CoA transferase [Syntrophales bacterium]|jgi:formyl-CoA transferase|nr:CoA transferase [Syntrophales bacterium]